MTDALDTRLRRRVETLAGEIGERHVGRPKALHAAESFIAGELAALGYDVARQTYVAQGVESWNLEVVIRARRARLSLIRDHPDSRNHNSSFSAFIGLPMK